MNAEEARERVEAIRAAAGDDEGAHSMEDELYRDFIAAIAQTVTDRGRPSAAAEVAQIVLMTQEIEFARWCA